MLFRFISIEYFNATGTLIGIDPEDRLKVVPQKNAFIVDPERDFAVKVAAALRTDGIRVSISESDRDPLDEVRRERPDVVIARAVAGAKESGFALCQRVKTQAND